MASVDPRFGKKKVVTFSTNRHHSSPTVIFLHRQVSASANFYHHQVFAVANFYHRYVLPKTSFLHRHLFPKISFLHNSSHIAYLLFSFTTASGPTISQLTRLRQAKPSNHLGAVEAGPSVRFKRYRHGSNRHLLIFTRADSLPGRF